MTREEVFEILFTIKPNEKGCLIWPRGKSRPVVTIDGCPTPVSRIILERELGRPIKPGLMALHHCDIKNCINPHHLYEGSNAENICDRNDKHLTLQQRIKRKKRGEVLGQYTWPLFDK